jgi:hypothetical protein
VTSRLRHLNCQNCESLATIPVLSHLEELYCGGCILLTSIPVLPRLIILYCSGCILLRDIQHAIATLQCDDCPFLSHPGNPDAEVRYARFLGLQRWFRVMLKHRRFVAFIGSKEFNEWFFAPNGIGGIRHKMGLEKLLSTSRPKG